MNAVLFSIPSLASIAFSIILTIWYIKDKDKRKLMFAIGILLASFGYQSNIANATMETPILANGDWLYVPISFVVILAVLSSLLNLKNLKEPVAFLAVASVISITLAFIQLPVNILGLALMFSLMGSALPILVYIWAKSRDNASIAFFLSIVCFMFQGLTLNFGLAFGIPVLLSIFGLIFTGLMFSLSNTEGNFSITSFLKLKMQLDKANEDLKTTQEMLLKAERLATIGELAGMIGHDLRNPLQGIAGAAYYLRAKNGSMLDEKGREMVETIEICIQRSNKIINDLLEYSREIHLDLEETNLGTIVKSVLCNVRVPGSVEIVNQTSDELTASVDKGKIERVFLNIVTNALDAMPNGGKLTLESKTGTDKVMIAFKDTGAGMTQQVMNKIWTPLFTTKAKGMGFGLAICKRIVEAHGGEIMAESEIGNGSVFTVLLPLKPPCSNKGYEPLVLPSTMLAQVVQA